MYVQVKLLDGFKRPLVYRVPNELQSTICVGSVVKVPIRNRVAFALVDMVYTQKPPESDYEIKIIQSIEQVPLDNYYNSFLQKLGAYYQQEPLSFFRRLQTFLEQKEQKEERGLLLADNTPAVSTVTLTDEQQRVCNFVIQAICAACYTPTVLHGVTGSGKTEVYKKLVTHAILQKKSVLFLLPEVTLAVQFFMLLQKQLGPEFSVMSFHSATSVPEKRKLWQQLLAGNPVVIIGVHLPVMLPISNLGLIIIDEEHEVGYQEKKHPKINTKEAALIRAQLYNIPIVLGSATPSIATLYNTKKNRWHFFQLRKRFAGAFPKVKVISLLEEKYRKNFWISKQLEFAIARCLEKKEQVIIFLNRRGYSFFVQCKSCSFVFCCTACSVSLTLHEQNILLCHYCGFSQQVPVNCPDCKSSESSFIKKGIGTQQIVAILEKLFPQARIGRADFDATVNKKRWQKTVKLFSEGEIDILVGTQTIAKGYHFPKVTLVGVLWADINLHFPRYNAAEVTLQQLIQVAGRAGRQTEDSTVIIQTMIEHPIFKFVNETDYLSFYTYELEKRLEVGYPPAFRFCEIELKHENEIIVQEDAEKLADYLIELNEQKKLVTILGPVVPPVAKIKHVHSRVIFLKAKTFADIMSLYRLVEKNAYKSKLFFTPNPLS